jgi:hypothetical protein
MPNWYVSSAAYLAVTAWAATTAYSVGNIRRPTAATANSERCYRCTTAGTSGGTQPSAAGGNPWNLSKGGTTTDGSVVWTEITSNETYQVAGAWAPFSRLNTVGIATVGPRYASSATVAAGGSGYVVGDILTVSGATNTLGDTAVVRVATLSGSAVATVTTLSGGGFSAAPAAAATTTATTGVGTGCTITLTTTTWGLAAGDTIYLGHTHAETQASAMTLAFAGTNASPTNILCTDSSGTGAVPPTTLTTGASITTTGASAYSHSGVTYWNGVAINCGTGAVSSGITFAGSTVFENGALAKLGTTGSASCFFGSASALIEWRNTTFRFGNTSDNFQVSTTFVWRNTASAIHPSGSVPVSLFASSSSRVLVEGIDLSALGAGTTIFGASSTLLGAILKDCKLGASVTVAATPTGLAAAIDLVRCDSGDTNYRSERYRYQGTLTTETTIVRTGGASDGTTPIAWKIVTNANSKRYSPLEAMLISIWNETTGSPITLTVEGIWGGAAVPTNADIWMDVEYLGTSGFPLGLFASSAPTNQLASGTNLSAGSGIWGGSTTKFKLEKTITPQAKGPITVYLKAALASSTFFIDPKITVS